MTTYLLISLIALLIGPAVYSLCNKSEKSLCFIDGFVFTSIVCLLFKHILESGSQSSIFISGIMLSLGFLGPGLLESFFIKSQSTIHKKFILLGIFGLFMHAITDGMALTEQSAHHSASLGKAVLLHRIPIGLTIWWLIKPKFGVVFASISLFSIMLGTVVGYHSSDLINIETNLFTYIQAFVAGSILHVVFFKIHLEGLSNCLLYTSPSPRDATLSRMPSSA